MAHVGILGGTFNPPHVGHLALARRARAELGLERVLLMPANVAPNKPAAGADPGPERRLAMCRLAVAREPGLEASALEIERGGTSYTVDTVQAVHDADPDADLTLIMGADTACTLLDWREPARLLGMVDLAVAERDELDVENVYEALTLIAEIDDPLARLTMLPMGRVAVSSSGVRAAIAAERPVTEMIGAAVASYIAEHRLYRAAQAPALGIGGAR